MSHGMLKIAIVLRGPNVDAFRALERASGLDPVGVLMLGLWHLARHYEFKAEAPRLARPARGKAGA